MHFSLKWTKLTYTGTKTGVITVIANTCKLCIILYVALPVKFINEEGSQADNFDIEREGIFLLIPKLYENTSKLIDILRTKYKIYILQ